MLNINRYELVLSRFHQPIDDQSRYTLWVDDMDDMHKLSYVIAYVLWLNTCNETYYHLMLASQIAGNVFGSREIEAMALAGFIKRSYPTEQELIDVHDETLRYLLLRLCTNDTLKMRGSLN